MNFLRRIAIFIGPHSSNNGILALFSGWGSTSGLPDDPVVNEESSELWLSCSAGRAVPPGCTARNGERQAPGPAAQQSSELKVVLSAARAKPASLERTGALRDWKTAIQIHHFPLYCINLSNFLKLLPPPVNMHITLSHWVQWGNICSVFRRVTGI